VSSVARVEFDRIASSYDDLWTNSPVGRLQREAVWRHIDPLVRAGDVVLDLGCGTGADILHLAQAGARVSGIDVSPEMVRIARARGVDARLLPIEEISSIRGVYDIVLSNFGALNCVEHLAPLCDPLARLVRPHGHLAICLLGRYCLWETAYFAVRGQFGKAIRRWSGRAVTAAGARVYYPSAEGIRRALWPRFEAVADVGIGVAVPPSFVSGLPRALLRRLAWIDARIGAAPMAKMLADHRLLIFSRR
jgi:SAM-dependent methyltransferase